jgi:Subtilase family
MATTPQDTPNLSPELVVVAHSDARLRLSGSRVRSSADGAAALEQALAETGARLRPLFGASEERIHATRRASAWDLPDLSVFYHAAVDGDHQAVAARLAEVPAVSGAFVKPPPAIDADLLAASADVASAAAAAAGTPDLTPHQGYLAAAPDGISASSVRSQPGGDGTGVQVINVGGAWRLTHEDLAGNVGGVVGGQPIDAVSFRNHGTAMLGVIRATLNVFGMTGIAPGCQVRQVATFGLGTAAAIRLAADSLPAGGVILIEWQRPGPGSTGVGAAGFLPLEWWPDDFAAIAYATAKGVIVIEPAGNGAVSLDDPLYNTPAPGFPATWHNPFNRANADCGSILVGAGAPPPGANSTVPDRSRLPFSNTGASVDAQGWGAGIATLGYGDLQGGATEDLWYTATFGGTSGAAAMVAGVVAALQGLQLAGPKRPPLTPGDVRRLLRQSGSPQQAGPDGPPTAHPIGSRPDLVALLALLTAPKNESKDSKDAKNESKENKDSKDAKDSPDKSTKDNKDGKDNKESKDDKDNPDNQVKIEKDFRDKNSGKGEHGNEQPKVTPLSPGTPTALAAPRRSAAPVRHFIPGELRPELSASALLNEPDLRGRDAAGLADDLRPPEISGPGGEPMVTGAA